MSRRAPVIEEFDDDTELPLPSQPLLNTGERGALLEAIDDDDSDFEELASNNSKSYPAAGPATPSQQQQFTPQRPDPNLVSDITPYKSWTCIYPIYIDAKRSYGIGERRIARPKSVWWPLSKDIADAASRLGLSTLHEVQKCHPRDWENPGRVRVQWKKDGKLANPTLKTKKKLLEAISFYIQNVKPELIPRPSSHSKENDQSNADKQPQKAASTKGKQPAKNKATPLSKPRALYAQLPEPPKPYPALQSRVSAYSPAIATGVLIETVKAGMNASEGAGGPAPIAPGGGKGKRKVVRVRG